MAIQGSRAFYSVKSLGDAEAQAKLAGYVVHFRQPMPNQKGQWVVFARPMNNVI